MTINYNALYQTGDLIKEKSMDLVSVQEEFEKIKNILLYSKNMEELSKEAENLSQKIEECIMLLDEVNMVLYDIADNYKRSEEMLYETLDGLRYVKKSAFPIVTKIDNIPDIISKNFDKQEIIK